MCFFIFSFIRFIVIFMYVFECWENTFIVSIVYLLGKCFWFLNFVLFIFIVFLGKRKNDLIGKFGSVVCFVFLG